jgi:hypothetical protein
VLDRDFGKQQRILFYRYMAESPSEFVTLATRKSTENTSVERLEIASNALCSSPKSLHILFM